MKRVTGIGGVFFRSKDKTATGDWYRKHLGLDVEDWGGTSFEWRHKDDPEKPGTTVWSPFANDTEYFGSSGQSFMVNLRVDDLDALLEVLAEEGVEILEKRSEDEFGKFAWIVDADGRRVELWQPAPSL